MNDSNRKRRKLDLELCGENFIKSGDSINSYIYNGTGTFFNNTQII